MGAHTHYPSLGRLKEILGLVLVLGLWVSCGTVGPTSPKEPQKIPQPLEDDDASDPSEGEEVGDGSPCPDFDLGERGVGGLPLQLTWQNAPSWISSPARHATDIPYDTKSRSRLDISVPQNASMAPLVIFIHGGGFTGGDKTAFVFQDRDPHQDFVNALLNAGMGFAAVNYRYLQSVDNENGVYDSLKDIQRAIQFIRYHAQDLGIHPARIGLIGQSAGAGASAWLALHDDMKDATSADPVARLSTRIQAAVWLRGQSTYDMLAWEDHFPPLDLAFLYQLSGEVRNAIHSFYAISQFSDMFGAWVSTQRADMDFLSMADACDAPLQLISPDPDPGAIPSNIGELLHHPKHGLLLYQALKASGNPNVEAILEEAYQISDPDPAHMPVQFLRRHLQ